MEKNNNLLQGEEGQLDAISSSMPVGQQLKQKRKQLGISKEQVAERLCLKVSVIEKMEAQSFEDGDLTIFIRGYFRSYAKMLDMDEEKLLAELGDEQLPPPTVQKMTSFSRKQQQKKHESRLMLVTWIITFVVIAIFVYWWWQNNLSSSNNAAMNSTDNQTEQAVEGFDFQPQDISTLEYNNDSDAENTAQLANTIDSDSIDTNISDDSLETNESSDVNGDNVSTNEVNGEQVVDEQIDNSLISSSQFAQQENNQFEAAQGQNEYQEQNAEQTQGQSENTPLSDIESLAPPQLDVSDVTETEESEQEQANVAENHLKLTSSGMSWVRVVDGNGIKLAEITMRAGQTLEFTNPAPYQLTIGTVKGLSISYGGKAVDLSNYPEGRRVVLTLPQGN